MINTSQPNSGSLPLPHATFDVVVMAASLGGIEALSTVLSSLPADFPAAILIVQHLQASHPSELAQILSRRTLLPVVWAQQGDRIRPGTVYIAPPDHHVQVTASGTFTLSQSPKVQFVRPSANPLFESVAVNYRNRALAVILTGSGSDGASGVQAIKQHGGTVLTQNMSTSRAFSMPAAAIRTGCVDFILSLGAIASALIALVMVKGAAEFFCVPLAS